MPKADKKEQPLGNLHLRSSSWLSAVGCILLFMCMFIACRVAQTCELVASCFQFAALERASNTPSATSS